MQHSIACYNVRVMYDGSREWRCPCCGWPRRMNECFPNAGVWSCSCGALITFRRAKEFTSDSDNPNMARIYQVGEIITPEEFVDALSDPTFRPNTTMFRAKGLRFKMGMDRTRNDTDETEPRAP